MNKIGFKLTLFSVFTASLVISLVVPLAGQISEARAQSLTDQQTQELLGGRKTPPFVAPGGLFSLKLPSGWQVIVHPNDPDTLEFRPNKAGDAILLIRRVDVPLGAHPRQLLLNAVESRLKKLPNFNIINRRNVTVAQLPAASLLSSYSFQGNIQYPRILEEIFVVAGTDAFILHFEVFEPVAGNFSKDLGVIYGSFRPRSAKKAPAPKPKVEKKAKRRNPVYGITDF
ncbi:hypothetical protein KAI87_05420 [Myxococcota bacterium]|nr:hypothetical protein [Myxococcota bacterium]